MSAEWAVIAAALPRLIEISDLAQRDSSAVLPDFFEHETLWALDLITKLTGSASLRIAFDAQEDLDDAYSALRSYFCVPVGNVCYCALFERPVTADAIGNDGRRHMICGPAVIRDAMVTHPKEDDQQSIADHFNSVVDELPEPNASLYLGDFRKLLENQRANSNESR